MTGDLNELQKSVLDHVLTWQDTQARELEVTRFKHQTIVAHPELAEAILNIDAEPAVSAPLRDDQDIELMSETEFSSVLDDLAELGIFMGAD